MSILTDTLARYNELGINRQLDYEKLYLYSIITHSTAIEGSTVTEIENQLLFGFMQIVQSLKHSCISME